MVITFEDDGCVHLYRSLEEIVFQIEALDAENTLREVFDDDGQRSSSNGFDRTRGGGSWWAMGNTAWSQRAHPIRKRSSERSIKRRSVGYRKATWLLSTR